MSQTKLKLLHIVIAYQNCQKCNVDYKYIYCIAKNYHKGTYNVEYARIVCCKYGDFTQIGLQYEQMRQN